MVIAPPIPGQDLLGFGQPAPPDPSGWVRRLEGAVLRRRRVRLVYRDAAGQETDRIVRPLALLSRGEVWELVAWCEMRQTFRVFRLDRIERLRVRRDLFPDEPGRRLEDYQVWV